MKDTRDTPTTWSDKFCELLIIKFIFWKIYWFVRWDGFKSFEAIADKIRLCWALGRSSKA